MPGDAIAGIQKNIPVQYNLPKSWQTMFMRKVSAQITGVSILDLGRAQIKDLQITISNSSAVTISGQSLKKMTSNMKQ